MAKKKSESSQAKATNRPSKSPSRTPKLDPKLRALVKRGDKAYNALRHEEALEAYTEALAWKPAKALTFEERFRLLSQRAETYRALGDFAGLLGDRKALEPLARKSKRSDLMVEAAFLLQTVQPYAGQRRGGMKLAKDGLKLARASKDSQLEAKALTALGMAYRSTENFAAAEECLQQALTLFKGNKEWTAHAFCLVSLAFVPGPQQAERGLSLALEALEISRRAGDRRLESQLLVMTSFFPRDAAAKRRYAELALSIARELGLRETTAVCLNFLSLIYLHLGLYETAHHYIQQSIDMGRKANHEVLVAASLETQARVALAMADFEGAERAFDESLALATQMKNRSFAAFDLLGLGRFASFKGDHELAVRRIEDAIENFDDLGELPELAYAQASLAEVRLAKGDWKSALEAARLAVETVTSAKEVNQDIPPQNIWWTYYQVLKAHPNNRKYLDPKDHSKGTLDDEAERALDRAFELAKSNVAEVTDTGLKRSYWNRVENNRSILLEVARQHAEEGWTSDVLAGNEPGNLQEQLQRMLDIGVRMNEIRDPGELSGFVMAQLVELSGAEDVALIFEDEESLRTCRAQKGFASGVDPVAFSRPLLDEASRVSHGVIRQAVADHNSSKKARGVFDSLSTIAVPLHSHSELKGYLYAANHSLFGPFSQADLTLISAFANQAAAALDNASLYRDLEQRVRDRTQALQARAAELSIINSVQDALASQLDIQAIYDVVGDKLRDIFSDAQVVDILNYDAENHMLVPQYVVERGQRYQVDPWPVRGFRKHVIQTGKTLVVNSDVEEKLKQYDNDWVVLGEAARSLVGVPMKAGKEVIGVISLQHIDSEGAFSPSDVNLLETLAGSMSVAIENARLFDRTQVLLEQTDDRATELSLINSIQRALAAELDMASIYETVGVELGSIFGSQVVTIYSADLESRRMHTLYGFEKGKRLDAVDVPLNSLYDWFLAQTKTVVFNGDFPEFTANFSDYRVPQGEMPRSIISVPIPHSPRSRTVEMLSIQDIDGGRLFTEADVRLLETLAGSMGVALENARLLEETKRLLNETEQRAAELSIINSVQQGLSSNLEMQAIYDLVGNRIRDIFDAQVVHIRVYDPETDIMTYPFVLDRDERLQVPPMKIGGVGFSGEIIRTRQPILINHDYRKRAEEVGSYLLDGQKEWPKSVLWCPIVSGEEITGIVLVENFDREDVFSQSDVDLLTTLASAMSVALENARLFDETNRLLDETRQRAAELAIINNVGQALVKKLEFDAILEMVGQRVRELFDADTMYIMLYDPKTRWSHTAYYVDRGERIPLQPSTLSSGLNVNIVESKEPLLLGTAEESIQLGATRIASGGKKDRNESYLGVPFFNGDKVAGVISVQSYQQHAYDDADVGLLTTLASSMSVALENARLFEETSLLLEETRQRNAELGVINSIQQGLASQLDMQAVFTLVGDKVREIFDAQVVDILTYDEDTDLCHYQYMVEKGEKLVAPPFTPAGFSGHILETRESLMVNQGLAAKAVEFGSKAHAGEMSKSYLGVPLVRGGAAVGVISLQNIDKENAFTDSDLRLLMTLASSMSVALENARLFEATNQLLAEARQHNAELAAINTVSQALVAEAEIDNLIQLIGDQVRNTFQADIAYIALHDPKTDLVNFPYLYGEMLDPLRYGEGLTGQIIQSGEPLLLNRDIDAAMAEMRAERVGVAAASYLGVPIVVGRQAIGVISVQSTTEEGRFGPDDVRLLSTIAANAGAAIRNAQLYQETQRRASEMAALNEIGREASASLDLSTVLDSITQRAQSMLDAEICAVILLDDDAPILRPIAAAGKGAEQVMAFSWKLGEGIIGDSVQKGRAERVSDTATDPRAVYIEGTSQPVPNEKLMVAPLFAREKVIGAMAVWRGADEDVFDDDNLSFLTGLSQQAGVSIQNARSFDEIQRQKQYMEAVVLNSPVAIVTVDGDFHVVSWNPAAEKLFGYTEAEAIGRDVHDLHSLDKAILAESHQYSEQIAAGERVQAITQRTRKDGGVVDVEVMGVPVVVEGEQVGNVIIYHDLSELKKTEAALLQQKEYLGAVVSNSPVAIVTADQAATVVSWNPAAETLFGYTADEAIGHQIEDLIATYSKDMRTEAEDYSQRARDGLLHENTQRTRKDGTLVDVELLGVPVTVDGQQAGIIAIYHDITELKHATEEAQAANEAKSAFLATMSHEIRTPMNAVIGMSGLLMDTELNDEQREFAEIIRNSSDSLLAIINDILDFSKIEAGKMELEDQPFDIRECIEGTLDLIAGRAYEKELDLAYLIEDGTPTRIVGDVTRFRQILLNLLTNAVKFTEEGEVVVTVSAEDPTHDRAVGDGLDGAEHVLHVRVRDTGIGIPPDRMNRLFQSFSQVDASTARRYGGTGLGLAISRRLAEMMGGSMWAESEVGKGTVFHFTVQAEEAEGATDAGIGLRSTEPQLQGRRVLIVDDNDTNRRILGLQVKGWGMIPRDSHSPAQAIEWIRAGEPFDVAVLDMHMPEMDGVSLARLIRKQRGPDSLPLILFTSLGRREVDVDELEFAAFLTKPIKPSQLLDALIGIFADQPAQAVRPAAAPAGIDPDLGEKHPLRILLAEDNAVNQKLAIRLLQQMGYRADVAANGLEVLDSLGRQTYDVVLMDVQMPEMDGLEASREINRRWSQPERPRIVAMTANAMQGDRERCIEAGMDDYISKPVRVSELMDALAHVPSSNGTEA